MHEAIGYVGMGANIRVLLLFWYTWLVNESKYSNLCLQSRCIMRYAQKIYSLFCLDIEF